VALVTLAWHRHGGIERCVWAEAEALLAAGVEVHVFAGSVGAEALPGVRLHRVPVPAHPWIASLAAFAFRAPRAVAAQGPFDIVHAHTVYGGIADLASAHSVHRHALRANPPAAGWRLVSGWLKGLPPLSGALADRTYRRARRRHAIAEGVRVALNECYPREAEPVDVLYYGVDGGTFKPAAAGRRKALRRRLGLDGGVWSLFCGWDWRRKGLDLLLRGMARLPEARLAVVGEDSLEGPYFRAMARDLGLEARVRFAGRQPEPAPWFQACDLFVFPTRYEPFGMVVTEAMACGLPVLVPATAGASEIIRLNRAEQVLGPDAGPDAWVRAWGGLLGSEALRRRLGRSNRALAGKLTWEAHGRGLLKIYEGLLEGRA
jgi:glycosyltransferase involved in cell wall biosynthesis